MVLFFISRLEQGAYTFIRGIRAHPKKVLANLAIETEEAE